MAGYFGIGFPVYKGSAVLIGRNLSRERLIVRAESKGSHSDNLRMMPLQWASECRPQAHEIMALRVQVLRVQVSKGS
ncbi:hypothetical protein RRG08_006508 [Elysia crispata]|uniref:Uncharacterized protein n=1 Tax=Elysia crispata TaxID=231223 RepID=A0AAE1CVI2_9GAST|nr:hypothetical protein RRG08_006508 [Elysia crispata]